MEVSQDRVRIGAVAASLRLFLGFKKQKPWVVLLNMSVSSSHYYQVLRASNSRQCSKECASETMVSTLRQRAIPYMYLKICNLIQFH